MADSDVVDLIVNVYLTEYCYFVHFALVDAKINFPDSEADSAQSDHHVSLPTIAQHLQFEIATRLAWHDDVQIHVLLVVSKSEFHAWSDAH